MEYFSNPPAPCPNDRLPNLNAAQQAEKDKRKLAEEEKGSIEVLIFIKSYKNVFVFFHVHSSDNSSKTSSSEKRYCLMESDLNEKKYAEKLICSINEAKLNTHFHSTTIKTTRTNRKCSLNFGQIKQNTAQRPEKN